MKNVLLTIQYDGTNFSGWQRQPGRRTVQGELERVLSILCRQQITLQGTSRTDAGVHALGQRACFKGDFGIPTDRIPLAANHLLSGQGHFSVGDIRITEAEEVPEDFHPRFDALGKKYIYRILNSSTPDIMKRNFCYQIEEPLNLRDMQQGADLLAGEQDFKCFMAAGGNIPESTVRTIYSAKLKRKEICGNLNSLDDGCLSHKESMIEFEIIGNGFLYNMVRIIAGTLVEIGRGHMAPDDMEGIIMSRDRQKAGHTAPPGGLYLARVYFKKEEMAL
ncbi:tRNA pseudouridine(38-40) synthase TruA [Bacillota bacterium]